MSPLCACIFQHLFFSLNCIFLHDASLLDVIPLFVSRSLAHFSFFIPPRVISSSLCSSFCPFDPCHFYAFVFQLSTTPNLSLPLSLPFTSPSGYPSPLAPFSEFPHTNLFALYHLLTPFYALLFLSTLNPHTCFSPDYFFPILPQPPSPFRSNRTRTSVSSCFLLLVIPVPNAYESADPLPSFSVSPPLSPDPPFLIVLTRPLLAPALTPLFPHPSLCLHAHPPHSSPPFLFFALSPTLLFRPPPVT